MPRTSSGIRNLRSTSGLCSVLNSAGHFSEEANIRQMFVTLAAVLTGIPQQRLFAARVIGQKLSTEVSKRERENEKCKTTRVQSRRSPMAAWNTPHLCDVVDLSKKKGEPMRAKA